MEKYIVIILLCGLINNIHAQKIISMEADGNLESPNPCECVELSKITNHHNPADILIGVGKCIELKEFEKAAALFAISGVYGTYDTYRVQDKTAHQALLVLQQNVLLDFDESDRDELFNSVQKNFKTGTKGFNQICQAIQKIGYPKYYPRYMIQHGMQAFMNIDGDGLVEKFDSEESWDLAIKGYLHCGE